MAKAVPAFFSYSRQDTTFVEKLAKDLRERGAAVWLDQLDIDPGQRWDSAVEHALATCPRMLVVLSPAAVESTNVMDEVSFALEEHKLVIPVLYRDCKIPFRLRRVQYIDARTDYERGLQELLRMLQVGTSAEAGPVAPAPLKTGPASTEPGPRITPRPEGAAKLPEPGTQTSATASAKAVTASRPATERSDEERREAAAAE